MLYVAYAITEAIRKNLLAPNTNPNSLSIIPRPLMALSFVKKAPIKIILIQTAAKVTRKPVKLIAAELSNLKTRSLKRCPTSLPSLEAINIPPIMPSKPKSSLKKPLINKQEKIFLPTLGINYGVL